MLGALIDQCEIDDEDEEQTSRNDPVSCVHDVTSG